MKIFRNINGFTMIEVIAVLVILGITSVVAISRMSTDGYKLINVRDTLASHLRLAQARAMNTSAYSGSVWGVRFTSATPKQYHLFYCDTASTCDPTNAANQRLFPGISSQILFRGLASS